MPAGWTPEASGPPLPTGIALRERTTAGAGAWPVPGQDVLYIPGSHADIDRAEEADHRDASWEAAALRRVPVADDICWDDRLDAGLVALGLVAHGRPGWLWARLHEPAA